MKKLINLNLYSHKLLKEKKNQKHNPIKFKPYLNLLIRIWNHKEYFEPYVLGMWLK